MCACVCARGWVGGWVYCGCIHVGVVCMYVRLCKYMCVSLYELILLQYHTTLEKCIYIFCTCLAIQVGFERNITAVREEDGSVEVCIRVFNLPENALLPFPFSLDLFTLPNTAGNTYMHLLINTNTLVLNPLPTNDALMRRLSCHFSFSK